MTDCERACAALARGAVVAAATESSFGLLADISNPRALERLLDLKPRGGDKGQPVIVPHVSAWRALVKRVPPEAVRLAQGFWPGPLTLVLPARDDVDARVTLAGTLAARLPGDSPAAHIVRAYGAALTATSANPPGAAPALDSAEVLAWFPEALARGTLELVAGRAPGGAPSTLVAFRDSDWKILREGAISAAEIRRRSDHQQKK